MNRRYDNAQEGRTMLGKTTTPLALMSRVLKVAPITRNCRGRDWMRLYPRLTASGQDSGRQHFEQWTSLCIVDGRYSIWPTMDCIISNGRSSRFLCDKSLRDSWEGGLLRAVVERAPLEP